MYLQYTHIYNIREYWSVYMYIYIDGEREREGREHMRRPPPFLVPSLVEAALSPEAC